MSQPSQEVVQDGPICAVLRAFSQPKEICITAVQGEVRAPKARCRRATLSVCHVLLMLLLLHPGHLMRLRDSNGNPLSRDRLIEEFTVFFIAGSETTGHTVAWTL